MTRYARPFLIFFVSAVTHIPIDLVFGRCSVLIENPPTVVGKVED